MKTIRIGRASHCCALVGMALVFLVATASAQSASVGRTLPVDRVLARFERDAEADLINNIGSVWIIQLLRDIDSPRARQDSLLAGLGRISTTNKASCVRASAARHLALAGERRNPRPRSGVVTRLARIYAANAESSAMQMGIREDMSRQAERPAAAKFLKQIAMQLDPRAPSYHDDMANPRTHAVARLAEMGEEGRIALQELHRNADSLSAPVRTQLQWMASRNFPVRDIARTQPQP